jgi:hypothetical protein
MCTFKFQMIQQFDHFNASLLNGFGTFFCLLSFLFLTFLHFKTFLQRCQHNWNSSFALFLIDHLFIKEINLLLLQKKNETKRTFWPFSSSSIYLGECRYRFCVSRETPSFYWDDLVKIRAYTKSSG